MRPLDYDPRRKHRQSRASFCLSLAKSTVCCLCCLQTTKLRRIQSSNALFFEPHLHLAWHRCIFLVHIALQPRLGNICDSNNACQRYLFEQQLVNQGFSLIANHLILRVFYKLTSTVLTKMVLFTVVDESILDDRFGVTARAIR